jgi:hypothetical protein
MAISKKLYDKTVKNYAERLKEEGKWTECHELGHDFKSVDNLICKRCGEDFNQLVENLEKDIKVH